MSAPGLDPACVDLAEYFLEEDLRPGEDLATSARVLALAAAIQDAVEAWLTAHTDEEIVP